MGRKIPARNEVEVYVSKSGRVCIAERGSQMGDQLIALDPEQVTTVIAWLGECQAEAVEVRARLEAGEDESDEDDEDA